MIRRLIMVASTLLLLLPAGCRKTEGQAPSGGTKDSSKAADTASQAAPAEAAVQLSYEQEQGKVVFAKYCAVCHGDDGKGDGFNAFNLDPKPRDFTDTKIMSGLNDDRLRETVRQGGRGVNKSPLMPSWGGTLTSAQIEYVVEYVKTFAGQK